MGFPAQRAPPFDTRAGETSTAFLARAGARHGLSTSDHTRTAPGPRQRGVNPPAGRAREARTRQTRACAIPSLAGARRRGMESPRCGSRVQTGCSPASTLRTTSSRCSSPGSKHTLDLVPDPRRGRPAHRSASGRAAERARGPAGSAARPWSGTTEPTPRSARDAGCTAARAQGRARPRAGRAWQTPHGTRCSCGGPRSARPSHRGNCNDRFQTPGPHARQQHDHKEPAVSQWAQERRMEGLPWQSWLHTHRPASTPEVSRMSCRVRGHVAEVAWTAPTKHGSERTSDGHTAAEP